MNKAIINKLKTFLGIALCLTIIAGAAKAQDELEPAAVSNLVGTNLPANAQRVLPQSVPAEVNETLDKVVAAGNGKVERGDTEVIIWAGAGYRKANAPQIISKLRDAWKTDGWMFEIGGEENGVALFSLLKDGAQRRAVIGFYGATDDAFVLALTELHQAGNANASSKAETQEPENNEPQASVEKPETKATTKSNASLRDLVGKWEKKSNVGVELTRTPACIWAAAETTKAMSFSLTVASLIRR